MFNTQITNLFILEKNIDWMTISQTQQLKNKVTPYSYYIMLGGTIFGIATAIISLYSKYYSLFAFGTTFALTNGLATYSIRFLRLNRTFEEEVEIVSKKIEKLQKQILEMNQQNINLQNTAIELQKQIKIYRKVIKNEKLNNQKHNKDIQIIIDKLKVEGEKLTKISTLFEPLVKTISSFIPAYNDFLKVVSEKKDNVDVINQSRDVWLKSLKEDQTNFNTILETIKKMCLFVSTLPNLILVYSDKINAKIIQTKRKNYQLTEQAKQLKIYSSRIDENLKKLKEAERQHKLEIERIEKLVPTQKDLDLIKQLRNENYKLANEATI